MKRPNNLKSSCSSYKDITAAPHSPSSSESGSTAEDTTFSPFLELNHNNDARNSDGASNSNRWVSRQLIQTGGLHQQHNATVLISGNGNGNAYNNHNRQLLTLEMQVLSGSVGVLTLAFVNRVLSMDAQFILTLWGLAFGMLVCVVMNLIQREYQEVRRRGLVAYLPESMNRLLTQTSLHEWMMDPTFMMETRHLMIYFLGLSPQQLDQTIDRLPPRRRESLRRPGLSWLLPESIQTILLPDQHHHRQSEFSARIASHTTAPLDVKTSNSDDGTEYNLQIRQRQPTYNDAIEGILAMLVSPFVLEAAPLLSQSQPSNNAQVTQNPPEFDLCDNQAMIVRNSSQQTMSSDDLSMDLGLSLEDELGGGMSDAQAHFISRRLNFSESNAVEEVVTDETENIEIAQVVEGRMEDDNTTTEEYDQEGQVITDAISSVLGNIAVSTRSIAERALEYSVDSITPAVTVAGVGSLLGIGMIYLQPLLQRSTTGGVPNSIRPTRETNSSVIIGLGLSALGAGGFFWFRSNLKKSKKE